MKKHSPALLIVFIFWLAIISCDDTGKESPKNVAEKVNDQKLRDEDAEKDAQYLVDAAAASYDQERLADVALTNSGNEDLKKLANGSKHLNLQIIEKLRTLAGRKAITLPTSGTEKTLKDAASLLEKVSGEFNEEWIKKVQALNEDQLQVYNAGAETARDTVIRNWFIQHVNLIQKQKKDVDAFFSNTLD